MFTARLYTLMYRKHELERDLMEKTRKYEEFQKYAQFIGKGSLSIGELLRVPASLTGRAMGYLMWAHQTAAQAAQAQAPMYQNFFGLNANPQNQTNPQQMQMNMGWIMNMIYYKTREAIAENEKANLAEFESKLKMDKDESQTLLDECNKEIEKLQPARDAAINDMIPNFTGGRG